MQVINSNIASLNAQRNLSTTGSQLATNLQRLSSGLRINSAKDDAAGLAISERFSTQIRGLNVATRNANDGISLAQTAEGALAEIGNNLQRIRELAVQAVNATNNRNDREALDAEVQQLKSEIDRVATQTEFNGARLLDGSFRGQAFQVGSNAGQLISIDSIASARVAELGTREIGGAGGASSIALGTFNNGVGTGGGLSLTLSFTSGSESLSIVPPVIANSIIGIDVADGLVAAGFDLFDSSIVVNGFRLNFGGAPNIGVAISDGSLSVERPDGAAFTRSEALTGTWNLLTPSFSGPTTSTDPNVSATTTGFTNLNLLDPDAATDAILAMDAALTAVNSQRADLGALQNRFASVIQNLQTSSENLSASRSRIRDADYAKETAELTRTQILQQAGTAMLAQANQLPQNVLSLLR